MNTQSSSLISGINWLRCLWSSSFTACRRHLLPRLIPLPVYTFPWRMSHGSGICSIFGSPMQTQALLLQLHKMASLGLCAGFSQTYTSGSQWLSVAAEEESKTPDLSFVTCVSFMTQKPAPGGWHSCCQLCQLVWDGPWPSWNTFWAALVVCFYEQKILRPFLSQSESLAGFGVVLRVPLSFVPMQPAFS